MEREGSSEREEERKWRRRESSAVVANGSLVGAVKEMKERERAAISLSEKRENGGTEGVCVNVWKEKRKKEAEYGKVVHEIGRAHV